jgi:phosphatidylglycerol:prolipoprotein diacylglycerol transferase
MLDAIAPALALGIALGRIGCFLNGCCYGDLCDLPWAVAFPKPTAPWVNHFEHGLIPSTALQSLRVHPTQIYSAIDGFLLLGLLTAYYPIRKRDGEVTGILLMTYPITRFLIEQIRNDETGFVSGFTISQSISLILLAGGILYWFWILKMPARRFADQISAA